MKRFLALLLTLVMLVSVCGLQAFAADGDTPADTGDELVVYTRSGATRTFYVGGRSGGGAGTKSGIFQLEISVFFIIDL